MTTEIPAIVREMTDYDLILATIITKSGEPGFREESLEFGFRVVINGIKRLEERLFYTRQGDDGSATNSSFYRSLEIMGGSRILARNMQRRSYLPETVKTKMMGLLREKYSETVFEDIKPFATAVWKAAAGYR